MTYENSQEVDVVNERASLDMRISKISQGIFDEFKMLSDGTKDFVKSKFALDLCPKLYGYYKNAIELFQNYNYDDIYEKKTTTRRRSKNVKDNSANIVKTFPVKSNHHDYFD